MELLTEWGLEILFGLISAATIGYFKWKGNKLQKKLDDAEKSAKENEKRQIESAIEVQLEPIYQELEELRDYIRKTRNTEQEHMALIIASYKFRLVQLCRGFLTQQYITSEQMESLAEFYKLYTGLGGNGKAKTYYDKVMELPIRND